MGFAFKIGQSDSGYVKSFEPIGSFGVDPPHF